MISNPKWARLWPAHVVLKVATLGSIGHWKAPGTWGSLAGVLLYLVFFYNTGPWLGVALALGACYFAIGICGEAEKRLNKVDPGEIVLDEVVAMPICFIVLIGCFAVFRLFDILKPLGIKSLQRYYGGFGVVVDDVAAAIATCVAMNLAMRLWLG